MTKSLLVLGSPIPIPLVRGSPEWKEAGLEENGSQGPLDLLVVDQLGGLQAGVVLGEAEARMQHLVHPGRLEALVPGTMSGVLGGQLELMSPFHLMSP